MTRKNLKFEVTKYIYVPVIRITKLEITLLTRVELEKDNA